MTFVKVALHQFTDINALRSALNDELDTLSIVVSKKRDSVKIETPCTPSYVRSWMKEHGLTIISMKEDGKSVHTFKDQNGLTVHDGAMYGIDEDGDLYEIEPLIPFKPSEY